MFTLRPGKSAHAVCNTYKSSHKPRHSTRAINTNNGPVNEAKPKARMHASGSYLHNLRKNKSRDDEAAVVLVKLLLFPRLIVIDG